MSERHEPPVEGALEARLPGYRYGVVLLLLLATFFFMATGSSGSWVAAVTVALEGTTLLAALLAARVGRRLVRAATVIVAVGLLSGIVTTAFDRDASGALFVLNVLLVSVAPVVIARSVLRRGVIDAQTVLGALCIYMLIGMLWAFMYAAMGALDADPFFAQIGSATTADYLYFSYVTQTTVGYGDLTAVGGAGRALAVLEGLVGQIYLVTVVALLVGRLGPRRLER